MPLTFYNLIHVIGLILLVASLGAALQQRLAARAGQADATGGNRKLVMILHGTAMFLLLLGGFGALARLGVTWPWPGFVMAKFVIWLFLGAAPTLIRKAGTDTLWWTLVLGLASLAAYLGLYKPF